MEKNRTINPANSPGSLLSLEFYQGTDVVDISRKLLGKVLVSQFDGITTAGMIVETEAYRGPDDKACHAYNNRRTPRTEVMFQPGGISYVYLCYGMHHLFNVVTAGEDQPHAVLIRAIEPLEGADVMLKRRGFDSMHYRLTAGPGSLSKALGIYTRHTGLSLTDTTNPVWIEDRGILVSDDNIQSSSRIGVESSGECASWPWRFTIRGSKWISMPHTVR